MSDTRSFGGVGLGLALAVNIVEKLLGGHMWIDRSVTARDIQEGKAPTDATTGTTIAFCTIIDCLSPDELEMSAPYFVEQQVGFCFVLTLCCLLSPRVSSC